MSDFDYYRIALDACKYAREHILKGMTQLANNDCSPEQRNTLRSAVFLIRKSGLDQKNYLGLDKIICDFEHTIALCKKFSLGNCKELALMALNYVIESFSSAVNAEVFEIKGGDHRFLVIGRKKGSHPNKPYTWGANAYICDPWLDAVYPASEFLQKTKNYLFFDKVHIEGISTYVNEVENFDPSCHQFKPLKNYNTNYITTRSKDQLKKFNKKFENKIQDIFNSMEKLEKKLLAISRQLEKSKLNNEKAIILSKLISSIQAAKNEVEIKYKFVKTGLSCLGFVQETQRNIKNALSIYNQALVLENDEKLKLSNKRPDESPLIIKIKNFFGLSFFSRTNQALHTAQEDIRKIFKK